MLDEDAETLEGVKAAWLIEQFVYEFCHECGGDAIDHIAGSDPLGNLHAYCKPFDVGERVDFTTATGKPTSGTIIKRLGARIQIVAHLDAFTSHWMTDTDVMRSHPE